jgi:glycosyltransferase involved in cell wall biosynthesis
MTLSKSIPGIAIIGTQAKGGIRAVIENHKKAGVYGGYETFFIASHDDGNALFRVKLAAFALFRLISLIFRRKISICHLHGSMKGSIYRKAIYISVCRWLGCKTVFHLHGSEFAKSYNRAGWLYRALVRYVLNTSHKVFVLSDYWKEYVESISINQCVYVINNFPSPEFEALNEEREFGKKPQVDLLFLGKIGQRKGIYDLVEAVEYLHIQGVTGFKVHVGGNGEINKLKQFIDEKQLEKYFNVVGWVGGNLKRELLQQSDVLLLPSHNEGLPISILEAFSAGLAVLSTRVGGIPDAITDERYGILVEPGTPSSLAEAMLKYINNKRLIETVAQNARQRYDSLYSSRANVEKIRLELANLLPTY